MGLNILFASAMPHMPQIAGGLSTNTHELIAELQARGHHACVLARLSYGNRYGVRRAVTMALKQVAFSCDDELGYPVYRARKPWNILDSIPRADVAVVQDGSMLQMIDALKRSGTPSVAYLHGLEFEGWQQDDRLLQSSDIPAIPYIANSSFTAARFRKRYGIDATVVLPVFRPERYRTCCKPQSVTFINPVAEKGVDIALALAEACPDIPFHFVKGWPLDFSARVALERRLRALPNVHLRESTRDMRSIYATTRILLVPSVWEAETWGRVVSEAHCSGIPVLGSNRGGLPAAIGPGGTIVPFDAPLDAWIEALRRLWNDEAWYLKKAEAAVIHAQREELNTGTQVDRFLVQVERAATIKSI